MADEKNTPQSGWNEYSKLVLKELETLAEGLTSLRRELQEVKQDVSEIRTRESRVDEVKAWKDRMDEVISPTTLKEVLKEHKEHREFMVKVVAGLSVIQFLMGAGMIWTKFFK